MAAATVSLPVRQTAIIADAAGTLIISEDVGVPELLPDTLLVKIVAVAINPADAKLTGMMAAPEATAGCDGAGVVVAVGAGVPPGRFAPGDRVSAVFVPMDPLAPRNGAFCEYARVPADFALKVPDTMMWESAATLGVGLSVAGYALLRSLRIPGHPEKPAQNPAVVLVYGGSTASGTMAIQMIRRSGCIAITTCSPKNFALVESYGAVKAWDYRSPDAIAEIKAYTQNALDYALDCFCESSSMKFCYSVLGRAGGRYTTLEPYPQHMHTRKRVKPDWIIGAALVGERVGWKEPYTIETNPELRSFGRDWFLCAQRLLNQGMIRPHPTRIGETGGFQGILEGIELLRKKDVSGEKLVYRITT